MTATEPLALEGEMTIQRAAELREQMLTAMSQGVRSFDLAQVSEFDTAGVQLLLAARQTTRQDGTEFQLRSVPPVVHDVLQRYGLLELLGPAAART